MAIAANLCIFTNDHFTVEAIARTGEEQTLGEALDAEMMPLDGFLPPTGEFEDTDDTNDAPASDALHGRELD